jgi:hypothetical protein
MVEEEMDHGVIQGHAKFGNAIKRWLEPQLGSSFQIKKKKQAKLALRQLMS